MCSNSQKMQNVGRNLILSLPKDFYTSPQYPISQMEKVASYLEEVIMMTITTQLPWNSKTIQNSLRENLWSTQEHFSHLSIVTWTIQYMCLEVIMDKMTSKKVKDTV